MALSPHYFSDEDPMQLQSESELRNLVTQLQATYPNTGIVFKTYSSFSLLTDEIRERTDMGQIDLIVSGTNGTGGSPDIFLGSNTMRIIKSAGSCPVLVIPVEAACVRPSNIGLATDFNATFSDLQLDYLHFFASQAPVRLAIIYVGSETDLTPEQLKHKRQLIGHLEGLNPEIHWIPETDSKTKTLQKALTHYKFDLLVLIRNRHHPLETLFREPVVKRMAFYTSIPLLILPGTS